MNRPSDLVNIGDSRVSILKDALNERYRAMHSIRERVEKICLWSLGLLLLVAGWLVDKGATFGFFERVWMALALLGSFIAVRYGYLRDLESGFRAQQKVAVDIEIELGLYPPYPEQWRLAGTSGGKGRYFSATYRLMYAGVVILVVSLFFRSAMALFAVFVGR
jgi:hypothetical protein